MEEQLRGEGKSGRGRKRPAKVGNDGGIHVMPRDQMSRFGLSRIILISGRGSISRHSNPLLGVWEGSFARDYSSNRPLNSHDLVVRHTISGLVSRSHDDPYVSHDFLHTSALIIGCGQYPAPLYPILASGSYNIYGILNKI